MRECIHTRTVVVKIITHPVQNFVEWSAFRHEVGDPDTE